MPNRYPMRGPNAYVDIPTAQEIQGPLLKALQPIMDYAAMRHVEYPHFTAQYQADASGNLNTENSMNLLGGISQGQLLGPRDGYTWEVKRIAISSSGTTGNVAIFVNSAQPSDLVWPATGPTATLPSYFTWSGQQFVMRPTEVMHFVGATLGANSIITISGQAIEVPVNRLGRTSDL